MDTALINCYRLVWADIVLIYDACRNCYDMNCLTVNDVARALELIVKHESDLVYSLYSRHADLQEENETRHLLEGTEFSTESVVYMAWEFFHGVLLNFTVEELSQYPFWVAKTLASVQESPDTLSFALYGWMGKLRELYLTDGITSLFKGFLPYLVNRGVQSYKYLEKPIKHFVGSAGRKLERKAASIDVSKIKEPSQYASRRNSTKAAEQSDKQSQKVMKKSLAADNSEDMGYFSKLAISAMCHPLTLLTVRMLTDQRFEYRNWILSYYTILRTEGVAGLYKGLTSSILFGLLPVPIFMCFGIVETVLYRRMAGQGSSDRLGGGLSVLSNLLFHKPNNSQQSSTQEAEDGMNIPNNSNSLQSPSHHSSAGISSSLINILYKPLYFVSVFKYGLMTLGQVVPGFITFSLSRVVMSFALGETPIRYREIIVRRKILDDYLINENHLSLKDRKVAMISSSIKSYRHSDKKSRSANKEVTFWGGRDEGMIKRNDVAFVNNMNHDNGRSGEHHLSRIRHSHASQETL